MADGGHTRAASKETTLHPPLRRLVLEQLSEPVSAAGLARRLNIPRQRLNYHIRQLEKDGLVECVQERRKGNCTERLLKATARVFVIVPGAQGPPEASTDPFSAAYLASAAARTLQDIAELESRAQAEGRKLTTLTIETEIRFASTASRVGFAADLADAVARLAAKYHDPTAPAGRRFRLLAAVHPAAAHPNSTP